MANGNQGSNLNTVTFSEFTDLVMKNWLFVQQNIPRHARQLFIVDRIGAGNGSSKRYDELDTETYADVKQEGENSSKARIGVGYNVTMSARTFSKEVDITLEMRNDNREREAGDLITSMSEFCDNRQDLDLTHRLTFAGDTAYTDMNGYSVSTVVGDGLALVSASHTLAFSSTTYSNNVSGNPAFSESALESALLLAATNIYSNFGEKRVMNFNTIVTGDDPGTVRAVQQLIRSSADPEAVQAGVVNVYNGSRFNHVILPNLATTAVGAYNSAKRRYWFVVAAGQGTRGWQAYLGEWISPTLKVPSAGNNGEDIHNYNWTYSAYCRYGVATVSPKGLIGSLVSS